MTPDVRHARTTDGVNIAWASTGDGPPLIHLPGVPLSHFEAEWRSPALRAAYTRLASRVRLIQLDGRGTGRSQRDVSDLSLHGMLLDVDTVIAAAEPTGRPVALLGFYHSVTHAIAYAARHPERVSHLVLFGGASRGWNQMASPETQALLTLIERDWNVFTESIAHAWLGWDVSGEEGRLAAEWFRTATSPANARATLNETMAVDVTPLLASVRCPVLVLHREAGRVIDLALSQELVAAIPNARLELLPGTSAGLFFEDPDGVVDRIADFVAGSAPSTEPAPTRPAATTPARGTTPRPTSTSALSPRELDVLRLLAAGDSNAEIAHGLGVTVNTVERHLGNLYRKIDARGRAEAAAYAVRNGLG